MPENWCPFDPGSGHVPDHYDVYLYPNDFPAFNFENPPYSPQAGLFQTTGAQGTCDVVLYSPDHHLLPSQLDVEQWIKIVGLWTRRTEALFANPVVEYVAIFENTGVAIGVTMPHPHGQIYAFPFVPPLVKTELESAAEYMRDTGECIYCAIVQKELAEGSRIVAKNSSFAAFLPFFGRFPTEMQICALRHTAALTDLRESEVRDLAELISIVRRKYDALYGFPMPLMMLVRQQPAKGVYPYFHLHVEFLPIQRSATKLKYLAGVETGTGTFLNDTRPEEQAVKMREAAPRTAE